MLAGMEVTRDELERIRYEKKQVVPEEGAST